MPRSELNLCPTACGSLLPSLGGATSVSAPASPINGRDGLGLLLTSSNDHSSSAAYQRPSGSAEGPRTAPATCMQGRFHESEMTFAAGLAHRSARIGNPTVPHHPVQPPPPSPHQHSSSFHAHHHSTSPTAVQPKPAISSQNQSSHSPASSFALPGITNSIHAATAAVFPPTALPSALSSTTRNMVSPIAIPMTVGREGVGALSSGVFVGSPNSLPDSPPTSCDTPASLMSGDFDISVSSMRSVGSTLVATTHIIHQSSPGKHHSSNSRRSSTQSAETNGEAEMVASELISSSCSTSSLERQPIVRFSFSNSSTSEDDVGSISAPTTPGSLGTRLVRNLVAGLDSGAEDDNDGFLPNVNERNAGADLLARHRRAARLISVQPGALYFPLPLNRFIEAELVLRNLTPQPVTYKIKGTAPHCYVVRPTIGVIAPGGSAACKVTMRPTQEDPSKLRHRFLVESRVLSKAEAEAVKMPVNPSLHQSGDSDGSIGLSIASGASGSSAASLGVGSESSGTSGTSGGSCAVEVPDARSLWTGKRRAGVRSLQLKCHFVDVMEMPARFVVRYSAPASGELMSDCGSRLGEYEGEHSDFSHAMLDDSALPPPQVASVTAVRVAAADRFDNSVVVPPPSASSFHASISTIPLPPPVPFSPPK